MSREKLEKVKRKWEEKIALYEYELAITDSAGKKFELRERIKECQTEIQRLHDAMCQKVLWVLELNANFDEFDQAKQEAITNFCQQLSGDISLTLKRVKRGSIKLVFEGSQEGMEKIRALFDSGKLTAILEIPIQNISLVTEEKELPFQIQSLKDSPLTASLSESKTSYSSENNNSSKQMPPESNIPIIFICYAHTDNESKDRNNRWLDRLQEQLESLQLQEKTEIWSDQKIELGGDWHEKIQTTLQQVKAAVLLVSPAFLASKYIRNSELPVLLKNAQDRGVVILPIIVRQCMYRETKFRYPNPKTGPEELFLNEFQLPTTKALNSLEEHEQDEVLYQVAQRIYKIVNSPKL